MTLLAELLWGALATLQAPWFLFLLCFVILACVMCSHMALKKPQTKADIRTSLETRSPARLYHRIMMRVLKRLYRWLTPRSVEEHPKPPKGSEDLFNWRFTPLASTKAEATRLGRAGWSWPVLDKALLFAAAYPLISLILDGVIVGQNHWLNSFIVVEQRPNWGPQAAMLGSMTLLLFSTQLQEWLASSPSSILRKVSGWAQFIAAALAVLFGGLALLIFIFAMAFATVFAVASAGATRRQRGLLGYFCVMLVFMALLLFNAHSAGKTLTETRASLLVFLGLFPLINALFDFISYGATLRLARWGLRSRSGARAVLAGIADLGLALCLFTALGAALLAGIAALNAAAGTDVIALQPLFDSLRSDRAFADNWWIFAMLFSTAIPTLAHLCVASFATPALMWPSARAWLVKQMDQIDMSLPASFYYHGGIALFWTIGLLGPVVIIGSVATVVWQHNPLIGQTYLQIFEWVAVSLGLIDQGGPGLLP